MNKRAPLLRFSHKSPCCRFSLPGASLEQGAVDPFNRPAANHGLAVAGRNPQADVTPITPPYSFEEYLHELAPLPAEEGGGVLITLPDLPGCMADGETIEETTAHGRDAFSAWVAAAIDSGRTVPKPSARPVELVEASGRFVTRLPKSLHCHFS